MQSVTCIGAKREISFTPKKILKPKKLVIKNPTHHKNWITKTTFFPKTQASKRKFWLLKKKKKKRFFLMGRVFAWINLTDQIKLHWNMIWIQALYECHTIAHWAHCGFAQWHPQDPAKSLLSTCKLQFCRDLRPSQRQADFQRVTCSTQDTASHFQSLFQTRIV